MQVPHPAVNNVNGLHSLADILRQESERLRELADACQRRDEYEAEMRTNSPHFKRFVYDYKPTAAPALLATAAAN